MRVRDLDSRLGSIGIGVERQLLVPAAVPAIALQETSSTYRLPVSYSSACSSSSLAGRNPRTLGTAAPQAVLDPGGPASHPKGDGQTDPPGKIPSRADRNSRQCASVHDVVFT